MFLVKQKKNIVQNTNSTNTNTIELTHQGCQSLVPVAVPAIFHIEEPLCSICYRNSLQQKPKIT